MFLQKNITSSVSDQSQRNFGQISPGTRTISDLNISPADVADFAPHITGGVTGRASSPMGAQAVRISAILLEFARLGA